MFVKYFTTSRHIFYFFYFSPFESRLLPVTCTPTRSVKGSWVVPRAQFRSNAIGVRANLSWGELQLLTFWQYWGALWPKKKPEIHPFKLGT